MKTELTKNLLCKFIKEKGLPSSVGARGWSQQECSYSLDGEELGVVQECNKGWIYIRADGKSEDGDSYDDEIAYDNFEDLWNILISFILGKVSGDTLWVEDANDERGIHLWDRDMDGKSWDFEPNDDIDIFSMIRESLIENGEDPDSLPEDDEDLDVQDYLMDYAEPSWGDIEYDLTYAHALLEFNDGMTVFVQKDSESEEIVIAAVNSKEVDPRTPFKE